MTLKSAIGKMMLAQFAMLDSNKNGVLEMAEVAKAQSMLGARGASAH